MYVFSCSFYRQTANVASFNSCINYAASENFKLELRAGGGGHIQLIWHVSCKIWKFVYDVTYKMPCVWYR
jgi:hypothetical protein